MKVIDFLILAKSKGYKITLEQEGIEDGGDYSRDCLTYDYSKFERYDKHDHGEPSPERKK